MRCFVRSLPPIAIAAAMACGLSFSPAHAAPVDSRGKPLIDRAIGGDTPQGREFRAGIQAQLQGDLKSARARFEAALKIDPAYAPALIGLAGVAQARNDVRQTEAYLQQAEQASPKSADVHLAWGRHFMRAGQLERAEKSLLTARDLAPKAIPPLLELGEIYIRTPGRNADAMQTYRAAVTLDPRNRFAQYGLGVSAAAAGQRDEAFKALEQAAALTPKDPAPHRAMGRMHLEAGDMGNALASFDLGLKRQPTFLPLMLDRADALAGMKRWNEAIAQLTAAKKLAPKSAEVPLKQGDTFQGAERWQEAEDAYLKSIELEPRNPLAYNNLAWMTVSRSGNGKKAVVWASKAVEISPKSSPFHDTLGWAKRAAGDLPGAQQSLQRAIELEPNVAAYHLHLGLVLRDMKQAAAARTSLQRALDIDAKLPQADEARRVIKELAGQ